MAGTTTRGDAPPESGKRPVRRFREAADGTADLSLHTDRPVKTLADLMRVAEVDETEWRVESWECSAWTVPMKVRGPHGKVGIRTQQYRVKARLRRLVGRSVRAALDAVFARLAARAPRYPAAPGIRGKGEPHMAVFGLFDAHFGKLCWAPETGSDYDLKIAENLFRNAVHDLAADAAGRRLEKVLLPIGNDFYHVDNRHMTTLKGTPQDADGRYEKIYETGMMAVVNAVEALAALAPVEVVWVPGNHDTTASYHLAKAVQAWFRKCPRVAVDARPGPRKYVPWGSNLIGLAHGDAPKPEALPGLMATERPREWGAAGCREWLVGHTHRSRQWVTKSVDTHNGCVVRVLKSLSGTDAWHHANGFVGSGQAAEVYYYRRDRGYAGHGVAPARV